MDKMEGVIFDWAGTTVDFGCFAPVDVFVNMFKQAGIEVTIAEAREPMGMLKRDHVRAMLEMPRIRNLWYVEYGRDFVEEDIDFLYRIFEDQLMNVLKAYTDPIKGVNEVVTGLRAMGLKIGSTTGYTRDMINVVEAEARIKGYAPDCIVTPDETDHLGRPYPYMIFKNMEQLKLTSVERVIKVGDTISDIKEANAAGVIAVGVIVGSSELGMSEAEWMALSEMARVMKIEEVMERFQANGADYTIATMDELLPLIERINGRMEAKA